VSLSLSFGAFGSNPAGTASVSLNISGLTQFAGGFLPVSYTVDGFEKSSLIDVTFESAGHVIGRFESGDSRPLYKIPLALFNNPNGLEMRNGMSFAETEQSGTYRYVAADVSNAANFLPNAHELSNVDIAEEFTRMILTQQAYNSAATVFRTVDEMTVVARDLKR
jgi:flagellar hook protein FlgE